MNLLVKKEIRLLLPSGLVALLLALVQAITRPYDFYVASLLFVGLTIMALTTFGREAGLNTFSLMLSQPAERMRIWQTKLSVLAVAFLIVLGVWLAAFGIAFHNSAPDVSDTESSWSLFITICLIATATFTGGLWTTLLLRQIAAAIWLTLLVPATLSGFTAAILAENHSDNTVIAALCVVIAIYSVAGFLFARWLFFRAQDVGWSGGVISLPDWKWFAARRENAVSLRNRKPLFALLKKELQLQQVSLVGAAGLLVLHVGVIVWRSHHEFAKDSAGEILTAIVWMLWLVLPVIIGGMAVAEERRLGVSESQLCLPVSDRLQFNVKLLLTLFLSTLLGSFMPLFLEHAAGTIGAPNLFFNPRNHTDSGFGSGLVWFQISIVVLSFALGWISFFASTLSRNFLQAVSFAFVTGVGCVAFFSLILLFIKERRTFLGITPWHSVLPLLIAAPTLPATLLWLAYLNFKTDLAGGQLWRRNLFGLGGAVVFIVVASTAIYNRAWKIFEPAEPPHGPAKFSLSNPPGLYGTIYGDLLVQLPDGRTWFDALHYRAFEGGLGPWERLWLSIAAPSPESAGPWQFLPGSNWVSVTAARVAWSTGDGAANVVRVSGYLDTAGIKQDGTLWISSQAKPQVWTGSKMVRSGNETNWQQVVRASHHLVLLKTDGTLWRWGTNHFGWSQWQTNWPTVRSFRPQQIGTNSDWKEIFSGAWWDAYARKSDGSVWAVAEDDRTRIDRLERKTNLDQIESQTFAPSFRYRAYVGKGGTLWERNPYADEPNAYQFLRVGKETNWMAVAASWSWIVALRSDGSLWKWDLSDQSTAEVARTPPTRLGVHDDWVAVTSVRGGIVSLAADGSLWLWRGADYFEMALIKAPKQPGFLGNIFGKQN